MSKSTPQHQSTSDGIAEAGAKWPRSYRIVVEGRLDSAWSERLAGLRVVPGADAGTTVLDGLLRDQSELSGVVNTLCDLLHLPLLKMEIVDPEGTSGNS